MNNIRKYLCIITMQLAIAYSVPVLSAAIDVLDKDKITNADINTLVEDTKVFNIIGMGIALSIAQCDGKDICDPTVDENEIGQLIEALDRRIEGVVSRQQDSEEDLSNIITAYVDTKENYTDYIERLNQITRSPIIEPAEDEFAEEDIFADEEAMTDDEYSAFDDFDESLEDDEDLEEFEEDSDSEEF
ncbi:MAG: hypothetical protein IH909_06000 [Proteobacteria bacterium]|nr:hypothetical protein [Pseudomonadota bacterium]